jgi:N utilization substance protein B
MEEQFKYLKVRAGIAEYAATLIKGVDLQVDQLDQIIAENLTNWKIERLAAVDHTVLKMGVYEMMYVSEVPSRVTINEMVEIAKHYGSADSASFCNGVLDAVRKKLEPLQDSAAVKDDVVVEEDLPEGDAPEGQLSEDQLSGNRTDSVEELSKTAPSHLTQNPTEPS